MKMLNNLIVIMLMLFAQLSFANMPLDKQQKLENKLQETQTAIGIKLDQQAAWDEYMKAIFKRANALYDAKMKMKTNNEGENVNTIKGQKMYVNTAMERLDQKIEYEKTDLKSLEELKPAVEQLYKVLTPEQQRIADQRLRIR